MTTMPQAVPQSRYRWRWPPACQESSHSFFILLFAKLAARVIWIAAVMVAGKVQLILAAVEVFRSHAIKV
jgi:hypothetical protein